jgi:membrane protease YdiL (CAAX protease family)
VAGDIAAVLVVLTVANVWVHVGPRRAHLLTQPVAGVLLLALGRWAGLSWGDLGLAVGAAGVGVLVGMIGAILIAAGYALALAVPALRGAFLDTRYDVGLRSALRIALMEIPLSTVLLEEIAFRGVVWGLLAADAGPVPATAVSSVLFGVWHVLPALDLARTSTAIGGPGVSWGRRVTVVGTTVLATAIAGVLLAELRRRTGSLLAPIAIHWAANATGVLGSAWAWGRQVRGAPTGASLARDEALAPVVDDAQAEPRQGRES